MKSLTCWDTLGISSGVLHPGPASGVYVFSARGQVYCGMENRAGDEKLIWHVPGACGIVVHQSISQTVLLLGSSIRLRNCRHSGEHCRVPGHHVSLCLPLSPFMWVAFAGFLSVLSLSPFVSLHVGGLCGVPGVLSPFVSLHVGGLCRVPGRLCLPLSPLVFLHVGGLCWVPERLVSLCFPLSPFVTLHAGGLCRVPGRLVSLCLPSCGWPLPGS